MTLVIRGLDEKTKRSIRSEAVRRGLRLAEAVKEAFQLWRTYNVDAAAMSEREANNAAYNALRQELGKYSGKVVLIANGKLLGTYEDPRSAAVDLRLKAPESHHAIITVINKDKKEELQWLGGSLNL
jgi:NTP pyrophosphatase (non-canonical NTP hydrolase)